MNTHCQAASPNPIPADEHASVQLMRELMALASQPQEVVSKKVVAIFAAHRHAHAAKLAQSLDFVMEITLDQLREGHVGEGGVMFSVEAIAREGLGLPPSPDDEDLFLRPREPKTRSKLAQKIAEAYVALMVAGNPDDILRKHLRAARDEARLTPPPAPARNEAEAVR